jgi:hypothetical protein
VQRGCRLAFVARTGDVDDVESGTGSLGNYLSGS